MIFESLQKLQTEPVAWTLIHSIWVGAFMFFVVIAINSAIPSSKSAKRYLISCAGLFVFLITCIGIFFSLTTTVSSVSQTFSDTSANLTITPAETTDWVHPIQRHLHWISLLWMAGVIIFSVRLFVGCWQIDRLRKSARLPEVKLMQTLQALAKKIKVQRVVHLAESTLVHAPVVLGCFRPMILFPIGLANGLTTLEIETILAHELAHIRRNDYLINLIQCIVETLFFFNPFVWLLSETIRKERECCCDDIALAICSNRVVYANTLLKIAESSDAKVLAMSMAGNKSQLFYRIKRIMERSVTSPNNWNKAVPMVLLVVGLLCASWLTIGDFRERQQKKSQLSAQDTVAKTKQRSASYSRSTISTPGYNGENTEDGVEVFEGGESLRDIMTPPPFPAPEMFIPPDMPDFAMAPMHFNFSDLDTLKKRQLNVADYETFQEAFEEKFRAQFEDFYEAHHKELQEILEQVQHNLENTTEILALQQEALENIDHSLVHQMSDMAHRDHAKAMAEWEKQHAEDLADWAEEMKEWEVEHQEHFKALDKDMRALEQKMKAFQKELNAALIKDGYIKEGEQINHIRIDDKGDVEINDFRIRDSDRKKYKQLHDKYLNGKISQ